jgi:hypothetical protein
LKAAQGVSGTLLFKPDEHAKADEELVSITVRNDQNAMISKPFKISCSMCTDVLVTVLTGRM